MMKNIFRLILFGMAFCGCTPLVLNTTRRNFWRALALSTPWIHFLPQQYKKDAALAAGQGDQRMVLSRKPKAPLGALIPAAQQRLLLEKCIILASDLTRTDNVETRADIVRQLKIILPALDSDAVTTFQSTNSKNENFNVMPRDPPNRVLTGASVRAAFNIYTANLTYGQNPDYSVTDPDWRKSYIRANNGLPDVKQVIAADLDLRDLYRNQVQLKVDDAAAELNRQDCDTNELLTVNLLREAAFAFDEWLGMIIDTDVKAAMQAALEGKSLRVYDSYYSGFVPHPTQ